MSCKDRTSEFVTKTQFLCNKVLIKPLFIKFWKHLFESKKIKPMRSFIRPYWTSFKSVPQKFRHEIPFSVINVSWFILMIACKLPALENLRNVCFFLYILLEEERTKNWPICTALHRIVEQSVVRVYTHYICLYALHPTPWRFQFLVVCSKYPSP